MQQRKIFSLNKTTAIPEQLQNASEKDINLRLFETAPFAVDDFVILPTDGYGEKGECLRLLPCNLDCMVIGDRLFAFVGKLRLFFQKFFPIFIA